LSVAAIKEGNSASDIEERGRGESGKKMRELARMMANSLFPPSFFLYSFSPSPLSAVVRFSICRGGGGGGGGSGGGGGC
jgi:hypothetical protein